MPEIRYVQRDENGVLIGHYANPQPYATEEAPADHPDIVAFNAARAAAASSPPRIAELESRISQLEALIQSLTASEE